ncbi:hypothetical protein XAC3824_1470010 [Xanthomonas citri pv. citri]|nr:hypothetical protein XAC3824_1470010 [Xanthomonas citri pv. citri]
MNYLSQSYTGIPHQHRPREPAGTKIRYDLLLNYRGVLFLLDSQL